jgi:predicted DNA-binding transcriptional regulator AlpA
MNTTTEPLLSRINETAQLLSVSRATIYRLP